MASCKFLILNPSDKIDEIVKKSNLQHQKNGPFDLILLLSGIPVPSVDFAQQAYYYSDTAQDKANNLSTVTGPIKLSSGVNVLFLNEANYHDDCMADFKVDILILEKWPIKIAAKVDHKYGDMKLDRLVERIKPRYIITKGKHYEHPPFQWDDGTVSRFISLNQEGLGEKWFYAFNLSLIPQEINLDQLIPNPFKTETESSNKRPAPAIDDSNDSNDKLDQKSRKKPKIITPQECFFCLANPKAETHMIVTIGKLTYMTIAKGPLTRSNRDMPFSGHGIIIPIEHRPVTSKEVNEEINDLEARLFEKFQQTYPELVLVSFEFNLKSNVHFHRQFLPINKRFLQDNDFETVLKEKCKINNENYKQNHALDFTKVKPEEINLEDEYLMFRMYDGPTANPTIYVNKVTEDKVIDLQFPRRVLSYIIRSPKRLYWDKCQQPKIKEIKDCEEFKKFFN